jgi:hypothetical protein
VYFATVLLILWRSDLAENLPVLHLNEALAFGTHGGLCKALSQQLAECGASRKVGGDTGHETLRG